VAEAWNFAAQAPSFPRNPNEVNCFIMDFMALSSRRALGIAISASDPEGARLSHDIISSLTAPRLNEQS
jgi:hypothetical protein